MHGVRGDIDPRRTWYDGARAHRARGGGGGGAGGVARTGGRQPGGGRPRPQRRVRGKEDDPVEVHPEGAGPHLHRGDDGGYRRRLGPVHRGGVPRGGGLHGESDFRFAGERDGGGASGDHRNVPYPEEPRLPSGPLHGPPGHRQDPRAHPGGLCGQGDPRREDGGGGPGHLPLQGGDRVRRGAAGGEAPHAHRPFRPAAALSLSSLRRRVGQGDRVDREAVRGGGGGGPGGRGGPPRGGDHHPRAGDPPRRYRGLLKAVLDEFDSTISCIQPRPRLLVADVVPGEILGDHVQLHMHNPRRVRGEAEAVRRAVHHLLHLELGRPPHEESGHALTR
mmetsp:Transcript_13953/g.44309  ORF Transcript_13953/g.44309 Transcript_13953/m.44309 type:complete len:334 (+) Transcript_13953:965-1966(+)